jgi:hypothetical protein
MLCPFFCFIFMANGQEIPKATFPKRTEATIVAPEGGFSQGSGTSLPPLPQGINYPPDIDLRVVELASLVGHYQRLCDYLLELELEHEMALIDTGADHPEKNRGIRRIEVLKKRKVQTRSMIEEIRSVLPKDERKFPAK